MKVIDGQFGKSDKDDDATASDALHAFAEMAEEIEEQHDGEGHVAIVYITPQGIVVGGNVTTTPNIIMALQAGLHSVMDSVLTGGDFDEQLH